MTPPDDRALDLILGREGDGGATPVDAGVRADAACVRRLRELRFDFDLDRLATRVRCSLAARRRRMAAAGDPWSAQRLLRGGAVMMLSAAATLLMLVGAQRLANLAGGRARVVHAAPLPAVQTAWSRPLPERSADDAVAAFVGAEHEVPSPLRGFLDDLEALARDSEGSPMEWLAACNRLEILRAEFRTRFALQDRRSALARTGAHPDRDERIQQLAAYVAQRLRAALSAADEEAIDAAGLAQGLRALLAAGSSRVVGEHRDVVRRVGDRLTAILAAEPGDTETAAVLAALTDLAVVSGGRTSQLVREHATGLAQATVTFRDGRRPVLLHWHTPLTALADAGYVLRMAPAFGTPPALAARARRLVLAHLRERTSADVERPEVKAAMLYGFGDLVDRSEIDRSLRLWRPQHLLPDFRAVHHLVWGQVPVRSGWAQLQDDLRLLTAQPTPAGLDKAASLLMTLAMNFAAPGVHSLDVVARR